MKIIPTILAKTKKELTENLKKILPITNSIQIDLMDGKFVRQRSLAIAQIPPLKKHKKNFEAHLMLYNPEKHFAKLKEKGFKKIIFHFESTNDAEQIIKKIKSFNLSPWLAINPETKIVEILHLLKKVKGVLIMGVRPGRSGQKLLPSTFKKIRELRRTNRKIPIQIDGGVNEKNAFKLSKTGATILNSGSFVSRAKNPKKALKKLKQ